MALIESVFRRNADDRTLSFQNIAEETRIPVEEVEYLVMKALRYVIFLAINPILILTDVFLNVQLEAYPRLIGPSRIEGTDNMGPAASSVTRADWAAGWAVRGVGGQAQRCGTEDCARGIR